MAAALPMAMMAAEPTAEWGARHVPPPFEVQPFTAAELYRWFKGGEPTADRCEQLLAWSSRARGGIDLALAEGIHSLRQGERLAELGFHLDDFGREVLDLGRRATEELARLGGELRTRPLLREALRAGRVRLRAAQTVLELARGEAEAGWVERAATLTIRQLEEAVREAGADPAAEQEEWLRFAAAMRPDERAVLDDGLELAGRILPGSSRMERFEAMAQELLGHWPGDPSADGTRGLGGAFQAIRPAAKNAEAGRGAPGEGTGPWAMLPPVADWPAPEPRFFETATAKAIASTLRELARLRAAWDDLIGFCAHAIRQSRMHQLLGFSSFRSYCEERLGLPARAVEQRADLEKALWASPALQEARRQKVSYEKLRLLAKLPEQEIRSWTPKARALTCIDLQRRVDGERERQMRARCRLAVPMPRRVALLLNAAIQTVRERAGCLVPAAKCLVFLSLHFIETWKGAAKPSRTSSQRVRERDGQHCTTPGCSRRSAHSHHVEYRSHGGSLADDNQTGICAFHHLRCVHPGHLKVSGRAPDGLTWLVGGEVFTGQPS